ncbi:MAG: alpha/beta hydrolase [Clostridia bacterium]|nr:alpha/beta hydrolase [Clostridia bacterium]
MPGFVSTCLKEQLRLIKPLLSNTNISACRSAQDKIGALYNRATAKDTVSKPVHFHNFEAQFLRSKKHRPEEKRVILYFHGGGYTCGGADYCTAFGGVLAVMTDIPVLCVDYRLAPEYPFPAALEDAFTAYTYLLCRGYRAQDMIFVGESAGGGLCYALAQLIRKMGLVLPGGIVALSPWTDLTFCGESYRSNAGCDPTLDQPTLQFYALLYAAGRARSPYVSPAFGKFTGFPPSLILAGGDELIVDDARMLDAALRRDGCCSLLDVCDGMWHVYPLYNTPESRIALRKIAVFIKTIGNVSQEGHGNE